ncbi:MAG: GNAT family N-acetyltransferase [Roseburia sp.]|nr:GNAT family N-acetyltransferase [Roseburia sp.]
MEEDQLVEKEKVTVRNAEISDYESVSILEEMEYQLHRKARPDYFKNLEKSYAREDFEELLSLPCPIALVAVLNERIIGICFGKVEMTPENEVCKPRRVAFIQDLVVLPEFRGKGVAGHLMKKVRELAVKEGAVGMELCVWNFNEGALRFYERMGMKVQYLRMEEEL